MFLLLFRIVYPDTINSIFNRIFNTVFSISNIFSIILKKKLFMLIKNNVFHKHGKFPGSSESVVQRNLHLKLERCHSSLAVLSTERL